MQCTEAAAEMGGEHTHTQKERISCATAALMMLNVIVRFNIQLNIVWRTK